MDVKPCQKPHVFLSNKKIGNSSNFIAKNLHRNIVKLAHDDLNKGMSLHHTSKQYNLDIEILVKQ